MMKSKPIDTFLKKIVITNAKKGSTKLTHYVSEKIIFKNGLNGTMYYGLDKQKTLSNHEHYQNRINDFLSSNPNPLYEVLNENVKTKFYLDCELEGNNIQSLNERGELYIRFDDVLKKFLNDNKLNNKNIVYMDSSRIKNNNNYKISLHVIVNNCGVFLDRTILKKFVKYFKQEIESQFTWNGVHFIDDKVYNTPQLFRSVLSVSKDSNKRLEPFYIQNGKIMKISKTDVYKNFTNFLVGNYTNNEQLLDKIFHKFKKEDKKDNKDKQSNQNINKKEYNIGQWEIPEWKIEWIKNNKYVKNIYDIRNINENKVNLDRIKSSYCHVCKRNHDNENAFCIIEKNNIIFFCGRNNKGTVIGSWYNKQSKTHSSSLKMPNMENELDILKRDYKDLLKINMELRNKLSALKKTSKHRISISTEIWNKYRELGKGFLHGGWENIISSWKDGNTARLRSRARRVLQYMEHPSYDKVQKISLSKLFSFTNNNFSTFLSSL